jgi:secondary thiamine-phosphate synthase enzyme
MKTQFTSLRAVTPEIVATATLVKQSHGAGLVEITEDCAAFLREIGAEDGAFFAYLRHTSASLVIQENADPDVRTDLMTALARLAPEDGGWVHDVEGPDDMPAHIKAMLTGVSLTIPVIAGTLALGTWQGIYLIEHRARPHRREVIFQFIGTGGDGGAR